MSSPWEKRIKDGHVFQPFFVILARFHLSFLFCLLRHPGEGLVKTDIVCCCCTHPSRHCHQGFPPFLFFSFSYTIIIYSPCIHHHTSSVVLSVQFFGMSSKLFWPCSHLTVPWAFRLLPPPQWPLPTDCVSVSVYIQMRKKKGMSRYVVIPHVGTRAFPTNVPRNPAAATNARWTTTSSSANLFFRFVNPRRRLTRQDCNTNIWPAFIFCIFWFVLALNITTVWTTTKYLFFFLLSQFWFCVRCCGQCQSWIRVAGVFFPFHDYRHNRNRIPSQHANGCFLGNQLAFTTTEREMVSKSVQSE